MSTATNRRGSRGIIAALNQRRRRTIHLALDRPWLEQLSSRPDEVLRGMANGGLLDRVGEGRYVLTSPGAASAVEGIPEAMLVDLALRQGSSGKGRYYVAFLSALIGHGLTDLHTQTTYVAVPQGTRIRGQIAIDLHLVQLSERAWPEDDELERFRVLPGTKEFAVRAGVERTLVDALARPELCAGFETVATSWARARTQDDVSWAKVCEYARRRGGAMMRRTAFMLNRLGLDAVREKHFADLRGRGATTPLDKSRGFEVGEPERDAATGVLVNVPRDYLRGWLSGEIG